MILYPGAGGLVLANVVFLSYSESDREAVLDLIKGRAVNPMYFGLRFRVQDLLSRWDTSDPAVIRQAISKSIGGASPTIVFVGNDTALSRWVPEEVAMTLLENKPVYAIRLNGTWGRTPACLSSRLIPVHDWSESMLQRLADD